MITQNLTSSWFIISKMFVCVLQKYIDLIVEIINLTFHVGYFRIVANKILIQVHAFLVNYKYQECKSFYSYVGNQMKITF